MSVKPQPRENYFVTARGYAAEVVVGAYWMERKRECHSSVRLAAFLCSGGAAVAVTRGGQPSSHCRDEFPPLARFVAERVVRTEVLDAYRRLQAGRAGE